MKDPQQDHEEWEEWPYDGFGRQVSIAVACFYLILFLLFYFLVAQMGPEDNPLDDNFEEQYIETMAKDSFPIGALVEYKPSAGVDLWFRGTVAKEPWKLSDGTWVTRLDDMERAYGVFVHKTGDKAKTVFAADLGRLRHVN